MAHFGANSVVYILTEMLY